MSEKIQRFEDLIAWQKARELTRDIYKVSQRGQFAKDFGLRDQICRASVSIMSNIAEVSSQLYIARSLNYISEQEFTEAYSLCRDIDNLIGGLRKSLEKGDVS